MQVQCGAPIVVHPWFIAVRMGYIRTMTRALCFMSVRTIQRATPMCVSMPARNCRLEVWQTESCVLCGEQHISISTRCISVA